MSDVWSSALYQASFGGVEFDCLATSDAIARAIARHTYPRRDGGDLQDMGAEPRSTRCRIEFWERAPLEGESTGNHLERFAAFYDVCHYGQAFEFVHPITGSYRAMVESFDFDASGDERDAIMVEVTFVEDSTQPARFDPGSLQSVDSGSAAVRVNADLVNVELEDAGITSSVADETADSVDAWEGGPGISAREVSLRLATINSQIDALIEEYELATDITRFPLYRRLQALNYSARRAASLFKQAQPQVIQITVAAPRPLRVLAAETYGAADAEARHADLMRMNDIDDPSLLPAGTVLRAPSPRAGRQASRRRA